ncbi:MAG: DUF2163 domain-containing protein [Pseudomonadota bacterium]
MRALPEALSAHLAGRVTTLCRCWLLTRLDGLTLGFTDHDRDLSFDGAVFRAASGVSAGEVEQSVGLNVDSTEVMGALSGAGLDETALLSGRFDGAEVRQWLVNWAEPSQRALSFRGELGDIRIEDGVFRAEVRGLAQKLNHPIGRSFVRTCECVLGDAKCGVDLSNPAYVVDVTLTSIEANGRFAITGLEAFASGWFAGGTLTWVTGENAGRVDMIRSDSGPAGARVVALWQPLRAPAALGDQVRMTAGCAKTQEVCTDKFSNFINFRGFPHIPGEDWVLAYPTQGRNNTGGSLF